MAAAIPNEPRVDSSPLAATLNSLPMTEKRPRLRDRDAPLSARMGAAPQRKREKTKYAELNVCKIEIMATI